MMKTIELGSQIFINDNDSPDKVKRWVRQLHDSGMKLIRLFIIWGQVEPSKGVWDFRNYDACFEEAEKRGLRIIPTLMAASPPGWMQLTYGPQIPADIDDKVLWEMGLSYVKKVVERYNASPALDSWILWNEPDRNIKITENSMKAFQKYLAYLYKNNISRLNELYYRKYSSFDEVDVTSEVLDSAGFRGYAERLDWMRFAVFNLCEKLTDIKNEIRKTDKQHPVHVNPHNIAQSYMKMGQSIWSEAKIVDFMGCSAHPSWHSVRFKRDRIHQSVAYFADLIKSVTKDPEGKFWVTELQGGTNIYSAFKYMCPTYKDIEHWLWESIGAGAWAVVFWCFNTRNKGFEGGEWGLLNQEEEPSERLEAISSVAKLLEKNRDLFDNTKPKKPDVWMLYSENSWRLSLVEGIGTDIDNARNAQMVPDALCGAYLMCADLGLDVAFIDEERFVEQGLEKEAVLIVPSTNSLEYSTCSALEEFVKNGGTLIADGLCGMKETNGVIARDNKLVIDRIFGSRLMDIESSEIDFNISLENEQKSIDGWFLKCTLENTESVNILGKFNDGKTAIVKHKYHLGSAIRIGTIFFQKYLSKPNNNDLNFLKSILPKNEEKLTLVNVAYNLRMRILKSEESDIVILMNRGNKTTAKLIFASEADLYSLDGKDKDYHVADSLEIDMGDEEIKLFKLKF